jgi:hypothetical protein
MYFHVWQISYVFLFLVNKRRMECRCKSYADGSECTIKIVYPCSANFLCISFSCKQETEWNADANLMHRCKDGSDAELNFI